MVHRKRCIPVSIKKDLSKRKVFLVPGCRMWTLQYLTTQKLHIVLPPNMDSSHFACHHTSNGSQDRHGIVLGKHNAVLYKNVIAERLSLRLIIVQAQRALVGP